MANDTPNQNEQNTQATSPEDNSQPDQETPETSETPQGSGEDVKSLLRRAPLQGSPLDTTSPLSNAALLKQAMTPSGTNAYKLPPAATTPVQVPMRPRTVAPEPPAIGPAPGSWLAKLTGALNAPANNIPLGVGPVGAFAITGMNALATPTPPPKTALQQTIDEANANPVTPSQADWRLATTNDQTRPTSAPITEDKATQYRNAVDRIFAPLAAAQGPGGGFAGLGRVAAANLKLSQEEQANRVEMAKANAQMLHEQILAHQSSEALVADGVKSGQAGLAAMRNAKVPAEILGQDLTSDEVKAGIGKTWKPTQDTVFLTGRKQVGTDTNGVPIFRSTYTIVKPGGSVDPTQENAQFILDNGGPDLFERDVDGKIVIDPKTGQPSIAKGIPPALFNSMWQRAQTAYVGRVSFEEGLAKANIELADLRDKDAAIGISQKPWFVQAENAINKQSHATPDNPDPLLIPKTIAYLQTHPEAVPKDININKVLLDAFGEPMLKQAQDELFKATQKSHDTVDELFAKAAEPGSMKPADRGEMAARLQALIDSPGADDITKATARSYINMISAADKYDADKKKAELDAKKDEDKTFKGDNTLTGQAFLNSMAPDDAALVREVGIGKMDLNRLDYLIARNPNFAAAVARTYGDAFESSRIKNFVKTYQDYTSGKGAVAMSSGAAALKHLQELKALNTNESRIPETADYNAYQNKLNTVVGELISFYHMPNTNESVENLKSGMGALLNRNAAIDEQVKSMADKMETYRQEWDNSAPSAAYRRPFPQIDNQAREALQSFLGPTNSFYSTRGNIEFAPDSVQAAVRARQAAATAKAHAAAPQLPPAALGALQANPGRPVPFKNGQVWILENGVPRQLSGAPQQGAVPGVTTSTVNLGGGQ